LPSSRYKWHYRRDTADRPTPINRYVTTLFFINALSRIGLSNQVTGLRSTSYAAHLLAPDNYAETLIGGSEIYDARDPSTPFTRAYYEQHKYGTAWALGDTGQYFGLTLLFLHGRARCNPHGRFVLDKEIECGVGLDQRAGDPGV
jgi:hypothetical protein